MPRRLDLLIVGATPVPSAGYVNAMIRRRKSVHARKADGTWVSITRYFVKDGKAYGLVGSGWVQVVEVR